METIKPLKKIKIVDVSGNIVRADQWQFLCDRQARRLRLLEIFTPRAGTIAKLSITGKEVIAAAIDKNGAFYDRVEMNHPYIEARGKLRFRGYMHRDNIVS